MLAKVRAQATVRAAIRAKAVRAVFRAAQVLRYPAAVQRYPAAALRYPAAAPAKNLLLLRAAALLLP